MKEYLIGVDWAEGKDKSIYIILPGPPKNDHTDFSKDIEIVRRRIAEAMKVPIDLIDPSAIRLCEHPAFRSDTVIRFSSTEKG